jgi:hypothetical protein
VAADSGGSNGAELEQWIDQAHADTERFVTEHPFTGQIDDEPE